MSTEEIALIVGNALAKGMIKKPVEKRIIRKSRVIKRDMRAYMKIYNAKHRKPRGTPNGRPSESGLSVKKLGMLEYQKQLYRLRKNKSNMLTHSKTLSDLN